jgi:transcriptional regulator GlxA family with amidase domain
MHTLSTPTTVAILAMPETGVSTVYGMFDLFMATGRDWGMLVNGVPGPQLIAPRVVARDTATFAAGNGVRIQADVSLADCAPPDIVCIPELLVGPDEPFAGRFEPEIAWLKRCHAAGSSIATACSAAMLLAETGLLAGREATTHWAYCDALRRRHPTIDVHAQRALVASGEGQRLIMAGGGTSWLDLTLYLIARLAGVEAAMQVARINMITWHDIGQQPFARLARSRQTEDAVIARCQHWIAENYAASGPVAQMTRLSGLAERSFTRRFREATGLGPLEYVHTVRLEEAKQMLEATDSPVEAIANEIGYEDAAFFSRLFRRKVGLTPVQYRRRFGALRRNLQSGAETAGAATGPEGIQ